MKIKEVSRTANIAWSPAEQYPIYLAAGTAAQQLDATFSTSAALDIFHVDLGSQEKELKVVGSLPCEMRLHKLLWGKHGLSNGTHPSGIIVGGADNGNVFVWDANKILKDDKKSCLVHHLTKHSGPVQALDFNTFQTNLLATGGGESEILIWDLNNPTNAVSPDNTSATPDNISSVMWNKQVQHILASASPSAKVIVWDLRKSEPIIKVGELSPMSHYKAIAWHPEVATQIVMGNEDDRNPVIQMWDLRFATSPMKTFQGHQKGVLQLAWCPQDPDLLLSCGKDNRILCWNPNTEKPGGEIVYELPTSSQWSFDVNWCPRNPGMISTASFDGHINIHSIMGGSQPLHGADQVAEAFGSENLPTQDQAQTVIIEPLKKPPRWMKRSCGAHFGFGGKLISFGKFQDEASTQVFMSQVVTENEFLQRSHQLEACLLNGNLEQFCDEKIGQCQNETDRTLWRFLKVNFHNEPRALFLDLLGYNHQDFAKKVAGITSSENSARGSLAAVDPGELATKMQLLTASGADTPNSEGGLMLSGKVSPATGGDQTPMSDNEAVNAFDAIAAGSTTSGLISLDASSSNLPSMPLEIPSGDNLEGLLSQALLIGNFEAAVDICMKGDKMADAFLLAIAGGPELLARAQQKYFEQSSSSISRLMQTVINRDWKTIVCNCALDNWRESLAALVTYGKAEEFSSLCDILGQRLEADSGKYHSAAMVCYICAGNVERLVSCWCKTISTELSASVLQDLVEKVMVLKRSVEKDRQPANSSILPNLASQLSTYASLLASQGNLETAMVYLSTVSDQAVGILKDRIYWAQDNPSMHGAAPAFPFPRVEARPNTIPVQQSQSSMQNANPYGQSYGAPVQPSVSPNLAMYNPTNTPQMPGVYNPPPPSNNSMVNHQQPMTSQYDMSRNPVSSSQPSYFQPGQMPPAMSSVGGMMPGTNTMTSQPQSMYNNSWQTGASYNMGQPQTMGQQRNMGQQSMNKPMPGPPPMGAGPPPMGTGPPPMGGGIQKQDAIPPPSGTGMAAPMSMSAAKKQGDPLTPTDRMQPQQPQAAPMAFFNPAAHMNTQPGNMMQPGNFGAMNGTSQPQFNAPNSMMPGQNMVRPAQPKQQEPEPAKEVIKAPIPAEDMIIQQTLTGLVERCLGAAPNPQIRRKMEDVVRRLELLYDMLRNQKLSPPVLAGMHQLTQACQGTNYPEANQIHRQLIAGGNFSEISSFMPGLKTLIQTAMQLRV